MRLLSICALGALMLGPAGVARAGPSTPVAIDAARPRMKLLLPGVHRYLRYSIEDGVRATTDL